MANFKLDASWDLQLGSDGRFVRATRTEKVAQTIKAKILTLEGEFTRDTSLGIPWLESILGSHNPDLTVIEAYVTRAIVSTDDVLSIETMSVTLDRSTRICNVSVSVNTTFNETISINEALGV